MKKLTALIAVPFLLAGCVDNMERRLEKLRPQTVAVGKHFYGHLKHGRTDSAVALFSAGFIEKQAMKYLIDVPARRAGTVKEARLLGSVQSVSVEHGRSKQYIKNNYSVSYANGQTFKESLTFMVNGNTETIDKIDVYSFETESGNN
jgi:hypothetical protein